MGRLITKITINNKVYDNIKSPDKSLRPIKKSTMTHYYNF